MCHRTVHNKYVETKMLVCIAVKHQSEILTCEDKKSHLIQQKEKKFGEKFMRGGGGGGFTTCYKLLRTAFQEGASRPIPSKPPSGKHAV